MALQKLSDGRYQTDDSRYQVTVEPAGSNHGAVTVEDTQGASLTGVDGKPASKICRCGGLAGARLLIHRATGPHEYVPPRYDEEYAAGVEWLDTLT